MSAPRRSFGRSIPKASPLAAFASVVSFARIASALALVAALAFFPMSAHAQAQPDVARANDTQAPTGTDQSQAESPSAASPTKSDYPEGLNPDAALLARLSGLFNVEDPTSIYDFGINDNNVEFVLDGTWETRFDSFLNITIDKGTSTMSFTPPVFTQAVDLSSWILINDTWYFESSFQEQFTKNTVAAGYIGGEDDPVKHVRIGNSGITFPDAYPFVTIGGGAAIAPGVMGTFG